MDNNLNNSNFFSKFGIFEDLFSNFQYAWEILPEIEKFVKEFRNNLPQNYSEIDENVFVGENVKIDNKAKIDGVAIVGSNSTIGHAAYLRGGVLIGEGVNIGHGVEVKHSIILENSAVAHLNYIGDSILGNKVNVGGGAILANWRFDKRDIFIRMEDQEVSTNLEKFGSIVGDGVGIGVNSVVNPGTAIGKESVVFPLTSISGFYPENSKIKK